MSIMKTLKEVYEEMSLTLSLAFAAHTDTGISTKSCIPILALFAISLYVHSKRRTRCSSLDVAYNYMNEFLC